MYTARNTIAKENKLSIVQLAEVLISSCYITFYILLGFLVLARSLQSIFGDIPVPIMYIF